MSKYQLTHRRSQGGRGGMVWRGFTHSYTFKLYKHRQTPKFFCYVTVTGRIKRHVERTVAIAAAKTSLLWSRSLTYQWAYDNNNSLLTKWISSIQCKRKNNKYGHLARRQRKDKGVTTSAATSQALNTKHIIMQTNIHNTINTKTDHTYSLAVW